MSEASPYTPPASERRRGRAPQAPAVFGVCLGGAWVRVAELPLDHLDRHTRLNEAAPPQRLSRCHHLSQGARPGGFSCRALGVSQAWYYKWRGGDGTVRGRGPAACRLAIRSRCQRKVVSGETIRCSCLSLGRGSRCRRAASRARSAQVRRGLLVSRCRMASWWRRVRISMSLSVSLIGSSRKMILTKAGIDPAPRRTGRSWWSRLRSCRSCGSGPRCVVRSPG